MNNSYFTKSIIAIFFCTVFSVQAQSVSKVGTTSGQFLKIGISSRSISMGGAFTAVADDASALYWNPAGITNVKNIQGLFDHTNWFLDIDHDFVGTVINLGNIGTIGGTISYLHMDEMLVTTTHDPEGELGQTFKAGSYLGALTYAKNLTNKFSVGLTAKYINEFIYNSSAAGFAVDIGTLYKTQIKGFTLGMSISNFGNKMQMKGRDLIIQTDLDPTLESDPEHINANLSTDKFDLPLIFRFGTAYSFSVFHPGLFITVASDAIHPNDNTESLNIGSELNFNNTVFLRGGFHNLFQRNTEEEFTLGCGVHIKMGRVIWVLDYAYQEFGRLGTPQKVTISFRY
ncbi:MAG: PorV/PorQ family protein [Candidatus Marinimicrobia bacterium]|jgi:hypothetical protein|nr:PorV/PorQ family protein [Candidatus Neomarinimicrobiota bacterium]